MIPNMPGLKFSQIETGGGGGGGEEEGVLSGKVGTGMCGPDKVLFSGSQVYQWPLFYLKIGLDIGRAFAKCIIFDEFFLKFTYRLSKSTYICQFTR